MPIPVNCPECTYHFLVGDEFAGRPGRCPECAAIIHVPGGEPEPAVGGLRETDPYGTPAVADRLDDFRPRRRRERSDDWDRYERENFDDRPRRPSRRFDPGERAAAWERVARGLGSLQIAAVVGFLSQTLQTILVAARGGEGDPNAMDSGTIAFVIGGLVLSLVAMGFWFFGRLAAMRVPYVPARGWAKVGFFLALGCFVTGLAGFCTMIMAFAIVAQQGPNPGAILFLGLSILVLLLAAVLAVGGEMCGLASLGKIGDALGSPSAASWARWNIALLAAFLGLSFVGLCALGIYAEKKEQDRQKANNAANPPAVVKDAGPAKDKEKDKAKEVGKDNGANANGPAGQQQQNPFGEGEELDQKTQLLINGIFAGLLLLYVVHYSIALQKGRRAIRAEVRRLTGAEDDGHDRDRY
jgi:hypothetical protein